MTNKKKNYKYKSFFSTFLSREIIVKKTMGEFLSEPIKDKNTTEGICQ